MKKKSAGSRLAGKKEALKYIHILKANEAEMEVLTRMQ